MPELPEVETIRLQLSAVLAGKKIQDVAVRRRVVLQGQPKLLIGKTFKALRRFGKMLVIDFSGGLSLAVHLKMSGRLVYANHELRTKNQELNWDVDYRTDRHTHVIINFTDGSRLYYHDQRRFGWMQVVPTGKVANLPYVAKLGPEFLSTLTRVDFDKIMRASNRPVKLVLMDQEQLAGVGNIYANEALWCAQIHPKARANTLDDGSLATLFHCLEKILKQAIKWQGASENAYRDAFGQKGQVQEHFQVYAREGEPCPRCRTPIQKFMLAGRGTYLCPTCQTKFFSRFT